jgi:hypothetical protein
MPIAVNSSEEDSDQGLKMPYVNSTEDDADDAHSLYQVDKDYYSAGVGEKIKVQTNLLTQAEMDFQTKRIMDH